MMRFLGIVLLANLVGCTNFSQHRILKDTFLAIEPVNFGKVPAFTLPELQSRKILTNNDLPKRPYLISIWASWNVINKMESPFLQQLAEKNIPIVGVNFKDETHEAIDFINKLQIKSVMNLEDKNGSFGIDLRITAIPESFVVDGKGNIRQHILGEINQSQLDNYILPCFQALNQNLSDSDIKKVCQ